MIVKFDEDNFSIKLYRDFVKGKLVGLIEVIPIDELLEVWADRKTEPNSSEIPNNCEHITEDGVTCAKYPACDDCLDNPLNKVKGSERLVKGKDESQTERSE